MTRSSYGAAWWCLIGLGVAFSQARSVGAQDPASVHNAAGLRLLIATENAQPALRIILPGRAISDRSIEVLFPEHVTAVKHRTTSAEQLYLFRPGRQGEPPK